MDATTSKAMRVATASISIVQACIGELACPQGIIECHSQVLIMILSMQASLASLGLLLARLPLQLMTPAPPTAV